jgi:pilus assembly protein Flp/PilA
MILIVSSLRRIVRDRSGATAIEYAVLAALVAMAIIAAVRALGVEVGSTFEDVASGFS